MAALKLVLGIGLFVWMWAMGWHVAVVILCVLELGYWLGFANASSSRY